MVIASESEAIQHGFPAIDRFGASRLAMRRLSQSRRSTFRIGCFDYFSAENAVGTSS